MRKFLFILLLLPTAFAGELKVLSWNAFMLPKVAKKVMQNERSQVISGLDELNQYDVIMFQEIFTRRSYNTLRDRLSKTHPYNTGRPYRVFYKLFNSGLVIFSKYPLKDIRFTKYKNMAHADFFSSKGVLMAELVMPGSDQTIKLANTHLQAQSGPKYTEIRKKQLETIRINLLQSYKKPEDVLIFGGDFNISKQSPEHQHFWDFMQSHHAEFLPPQGELIYSSDYTNNDVTQRFRPESKSRKWIDFIFLFPARSSLKMTDFQIHNFKADYPLYDTKENRRYSLSDHHAVEAIIQF